MYLVIGKPEQSCNRNAPEGFSFVYATESKTDVIDCLKEGDRVFAVDKLTEITEGDITLFDKFKNLVGM